MRRPFLHLVATDSARLKQVPWFLKTSKCNSLSFVARGFETEPAANKAGFILVNLQLQLGIIGQRYVIERVNGAGSCRHFIPMVKSVIMKSIHNTTAVLSDGLCDRCTVIVANEKWIQRSFSLGDEPSEYPSLIRLSCLRSSESF